MEVLTSLSSNNFARNGGRALSSAKPALPAHSDIVGFPRSNKLNFDGLVSSSVRSIAKSRLISDAEVLIDFDGVMRGVQDIKPLETVHVKFKLERMCKFGEQFLLVGNHPMLGFWNPSCAVPMFWSAGDVWTAELDIPTEMTLQFKLIHRDIKGEMTWQPGADRIFKTWNCDNTIVVAEDWENAEAQKITEESLLHQSEYQSIMTDFDQIGGNVNHEVVTTIGMGENMINTSSLYGSNLVTMEDEEYFKQGEDC